MADIRQLVLPHRGCTNCKGAKGSNGCKPFVPVTEEQKKSPIER